MVDPGPCPDFSHSKFHVFFFMVQHCLKISLPVWSDAPSLFTTSDYTPQFLQFFSFVSHASSGLIFSKNIFSGSGWGVCMYACTYMPMQSLDDIHSLLLMTCIKYFVTIASHCTPIPHRCFWLIWVPCLRLNFIYIFSKNKCVRYLAFQSA